MPSSLFQVARLTRPARIRCRPTLALLPPSQLPHHRTFTPSAITARTVTPKRDLGVPENLHRKSEKSDYEQAMMLADSGSGNDKEAIGE